MWGAKVKDDGGEKHGDAHEREAYTDLEAISLKSTFQESGYEISKDVGEKIAHALELLDVDVFESYQASTGCEFYFLCCPRACASLAPMAALHLV